MWSERTQSEDPRLQRQQRDSRQRAHLQVVGNSALLTGRTSTGLSSTGGKVAAKIRHHGKPGVIGYAPNSNLVGVPLRLSATEVEGGDSEEEDYGQKPHHRRTGSSGRSSTASGRRGLNYRASGGLGPSSSLSSSRRRSPADTPERAGSLAEANKGEPEEVVGDAASATAKSFGSGSSGERLDDVPDLSMQGQRLAANSTKHATVTREKSVKSAEDIRRRGSVDERTVSKLGTAGRLFIANPD